MIALKNVKLTNFRIVNIFIFVEHGQLMIFGIINNFYKILSESELRVAQKKKTHPPEDFHEEPL